VSGERNTQRRSGNPGAAAVDYNIHGAAYSGNIADAGPALWSATVPPLALGADSICAHATGKAMNAVTCGAQSVSTLEIQTAKDAAIGQRAMPLAGRKSGLSETPWRRNGLRQRNGFERYRRLKP
jgi:hypothetical protein